MRFVVSVVALGSLGACAMGGHLDTQTDGRSGGDALGSGHPDAPSGQAATTPLLLSEVTLGPAGHEFIEIVNPTNQSVSLASYYLADNGNYFKLPMGTPAITSGDFIVKFPAGSMIAGHGVATVALDTAASFTTAFGVAPTYSVADGTLTTVVAMSPSLTDTGEVVVLFQWDGVSPLVKDVDIMLAGIPTTGNSLVSKSNLTQGAGTYHADAMSIPMQASAPAAGKSTKRIALESGHETQAGNGNGIDGDDETSEVTTTTWDTTTTFSAPTPGSVPPALLQ
jgi:hypothetical protein